MGRRSLALHSNVAGYLWQVHFSIYIQSFLKAAFFFSFHGFFILILYWALASSYESLRQFLNSFLLSLKIPHQRPLSSKQGQQIESGATRPRSHYGRKQYDNKANATSSTVSKSNFGNYSQSYGTITASGLANLHSKKWSSW